VVLLGLSSAAFSGTLYQWVGKDGTPTYSPDPPPEGFSFTLVDDNLEPLPNQPSAPEPKAATTGTKIEPVPVASKLQQPETPLPAPSPATKWKPVRYADDPALKQVEGKPAESKTVVSAAIGTPVKYVSPECLAFKQETMILESRFAQAKTDREMDEAILQLRSHTAGQKQICDNR